MLHDVGVLSRGTVVAVQQTANNAFNSTVTHFTLTYDVDAPTMAPRRLLLKLNHDHDGTAEASFYQLINRLATPLPMLVRCYAAHYDATTGASLCLLVDISDTHALPLSREQVLAGDSVSTNEQLDGIVDALGQFHAYWWQHPQLGKLADVTEVRPWFRDHAFFEQHIARRKSEWAQFSANVGGWFSAKLRALYEATLSSLPLLWDRYLAARVTTFKHLTLTNGDCYFAQFVCPTSSHANQTYIVDFQDVSANWGAYDLVYLMATFWTPTQRETHEERLLQRYHQTLQTNGVTDYPWATLLQDYKLMVLLMILDPVWNQTSGASQAYWWPKLQCLTGAFKDLGCGGLLDLAGAS